MGLENGDMASETRDEKRGTDEVIEMDVGTLGTGLAKGLDGGAVGMGSGGLDARMNWTEVQLAGTGEDGLGEGEAGRGIGPRKRKAEWGKEDGGPQGLG